MLASVSIDKSIKLWRISDWTLIRTLTGHTSTVLSVDFNPDGSILASGSYDKSIKLWRVSNGSIICILTGHTNEVYSVAFSPDGLILASGSVDQSIKLWLVSNGSLIRTLTGHTGWVNSVAFSPDGSILASGSEDKNIKLWRVSDGSLIRTLTGHTSCVRSVVFSPDGSMLASASDDGSIKLWSDETRTDLPALLAGRILHPPTVKLWGDETRTNLPVLKKEDEIKLNLEKKETQSGVGRKTISPVLIGICLLLLALIISSLIRGCNEPPSFTRNSQFSRINSIEDSVESRDSLNTVRDMNTVSNSKVNETGNGAAIEETGETTTASSELTWEKEIGAIFAAKCNSCHGDIATGGINLSSYDHAIATGAITPGNVEGSKVIQKMTAGNHSASLNPTELAAVSQWILAGAPSGATEEAAEVQNVPNQDIISENPNQSVSEARWQDDPYGPIWAIAQTRLLTRSDITSLSTSLELSILRNGIYAIHGRPFSSSDIHDYFSRQPWYISDPNYSESRLNSFEALNAAWLLELEAGSAIQDRTDRNNEIAQNNSIKIIPDIPREDLKTNEQLPIGENRTLIGHIDLVNCVAYSPDGQYALSGARGEIKYWNVITGNEIRTIYYAYGFTINSVAFSPDGQYGLAGSGFGFIMLFETRTGNEIRTFSVPNGNGHPITSLAFSPDGQYALSGNANYDNSALNLWDLQTGDLVRTFTGHNDSIYSVAFSPDGQYALSGSGDNTLMLWDIQTGDEVRTFSGHRDSVYSVAFSPDGQYALSGSGDDTVILWDVQTGNKIRTLTGHSDDVYSVVFSPDGQYILSGSRDCTLILWDMQTGNKVRTFSNNEKYVNSVAFSPDGHYALSNEGINLKLWNLGL
jgi:WD40 repeat protein